MLKCKAQRYFCRLWFTSLLLLLLLLRVSRLLQFIRLLSVEEIN